MALSSAVIPFWMNLGLTFPGFLLYNACMAMTGFSNPVHQRVQRASGRCEEAARIRANYLPEPGFEGVSV